MSQVLTQKYPQARDDANVYELQLPSDVKLMEWFYRIKSWEMDVDLSVGPGAWPANGIYTWNARDNVIDPSPDPGEPPATERGLVNPLTFNYYGGDVTGTVTVLGIDSTIVFRLLREFNITVVAGVETDWRASVFFTASQPDVAGGLLTHPANIIIGTTTTASAVMTIDGFTIPLYIPFGGADWTGTIDVYPVAWWPYAPSSGGAPVFDSATGTQINPNVVID